MRVLGALLGGGLGLLCMYVAFGTNGSSYADSATKVRPSWLGRSRRSVEGWKQLA